MFDNDDDDIFPTRDGAAQGKSLENRMLQSVGGKNTIRTKIVENADGSKTRLRTRGGMPEFVTEKTDKVVVSEEISFDALLYSELRPRGVEPKDVGYANAFRSTYGLPHHCTIRNGTRAKFTDATVNNPALGKTTWRDSRVHPVTGKVLYAGLPMSQPTCPSSLLHKYYVDSGVGSPTTADDLDTTAVIYNQTYYLQAEASPAPYGNKTFEYGMAPKKNAAAQALSSAIAPAGGIPPRAVRISGGVESYLYIETVGPTIKVSEKDAGGTELSSFTIASTVLFPECTSGAPSVSWDTRVINSSATEAAIEYSFNYASPTGFEPSGLSGNVNHGVIVLNLIDQSFSKINRDSFSAKEPILVSELFADTGAIKILEGFGYVGDELQWVITEYEVVKTTVVSVLEGTILATSPIRIYTSDIIYIYSVSVKTKLSTGTTLFYDSSAGDGRWYVLGKQWLNNWGDVEDEDIIKLYISSGIYRPIVKRVECCFDIGVFVLTVERQEEDKQIHSYRYYFHSIGVYPPYADGYYRLSGGNSRYTTKTILVMASGQTATLVESSSLTFDLIPRDIDEPSTVIAQPFQYTLTSCISPDASDIHANMVIVHSQSSFSADGLRGVVSVLIGDAPIVGLMNTIGSPGAYQSTYQPGFGTSNIDDFKAVNLILTRKSTTAPFTITPFDIGEWYPGKKKWLTPLYVK